ncbi:NAD(P)/FAD-dependent oxidoreductase [Sphaerotilus montanus]|uniref:NADPH-dependent 2,4-dienoyl-CoA reductase/sulfur reductase-like enzyme n=1 Tax=Sphaerotilus montanus TaxID=522889 RepID=A0A7Y9QX66_9BURK|nr:FAD/NAD(P)-binding oxidoreductase [Sphaerotilus montanus]NYG33130.1 NADPH-dependent 2,4-dienoyl-CoA reductase/sulfur reductase-like enzyme [Sphaerotilus montanus]NZD57050.1 NAD(P)/FAD-dependent oxidoreductase [Sphaerotilus montanus]
MQRRHLLQGLIAGGTLGLAGCASLGGTSASKARVLVIGGGYGGTTASKYIRLLSDYTIDVMMVEPNRQFVSCPVSNLVIGGQRKMADITNPYNGLSDKHGVRIVHDMVTSVDAVKKTATLAGGTVVQYDKLVMSPGIDFMWDQTEGLKAAHEAGQILHAWKAGAETVALRQQLEAMRDGGTYAITIPEAPYRCPPGPYERASVIAAYFKKAKPKSKVLILDGNPDVTSKGPLFKKAWAELYGGMVEYRPQHKAIGVDAKTRTVKFEVQDDVKADVLNVLPVMRAGALAVNTGLANANARWCHVNFLNFESTAAKDIHIIGDAIQIAQGMPKSGHMANSHAKVTAAAIVAELQGLEVNPHPMLTNVCMSFVDDAHVIHVASVHEYQAPKKSFFTIGGSGGVSDVRSDLEGRYADAWAKNIWADMLT